MRDSTLFKLSVAASAELPHSYPSILRGDWVASLRQAKEWGFDAIEIHTGDPESFPWQEVARACEELSMGISGISSGLGFVPERLSVLDEDEADRTKARERFEQYIDLAGRLRCSLIVGLMRGRIPAGTTLESYQRKFARYMPELISYAQQRQVVLVLEGINRYENNFLCSTKDVLDFIKPFGSPNLKMLLDAYHMNIEDPDLVDAIYQAKGEVGYFHCSDSNRKVPGFGHIDFTALVRALWRTGYDGYLTVEALPFPDPETAALQSCGLLRNIMNVLATEV